MGENENEACGTLVPVPMVFFPIPFTSKGLEIVLEKAQ